MNNIDLLRFLVFDWEHAERVINQTEDIGVKNFQEGRQYALESIMNKLTQKELI